MDSQQTTETSRNTGLRVLVLNADFQPLRLVPLSTLDWKEAVCLVYKGSAKVLENYDREIRSPTKSMKIPSVIVLKEYKHVDHVPRYSKYNVKLRDNFTCAYCNTRRSHKSLTIDHVLPRSKGGKTSWENTVTACKPCNQDKKDNHTIVPKVKPKKPSYYDLAKKLVRTKEITNETWQKYLPQF